MSNQPQNQNPVKEASFELVAGDALQQITKAEIDTQIATAHKFPRSMQQFKTRATEMATIDEETAASCLYSRPVGKDRETGKQKFAEGLSIRMAEIVGASYGNLRVGAMLIEQTERQVKARGYAHDLESNFAATSEVVESTVKRDGTPYDERMRVVIAKAVLAKARRDATFMVVPKALCKPIEAAAKLVIVGDAKTLGSRREKVMDWVKTLPINPDRVFAAINVKGESDIGLQQLELLTGLRTALKDGDITLEEAFPANYMPVTEKPVTTEVLPPANDFRSEKSYQKLVEGFKNGGWRDLEVHWGTSKFPVKGRKLGELADDDKKSMHFLREDWQPKEFKGKIGIDDLALRAALDAAKSDKELAAHNQ